MSMLIDEIQAVADRWARNPPTTREEVLAALDQLTELREVAEKARELIADHARPLIGQALRLDVSRTDLAKRPYSAAIVHRIANEIGIPHRKPGPPARQRPQKNT